MPPSEVSTRFHTKRRRHRRSVYNAPSLVDRAVPKAKHPSPQPTESVEVDVPAGKRSIGERSQARAHIPTIGSESRMELAEEPPPKRRRKQLSKTVHESIQQSDKPTDSARDADPGTARSQAKDDKPQASESFGSKSAKTSNGTTEAGDSIFCTPHHKKPGSPRPGHQSTGFDMSPAGSVARFLDEMAREPCLGPAVAGDYVTSPAPAEPKESQTLVT